MDYEEFVESIDFLAVSRAYKILKLYAGAGGRDGELDDRFTSWMTNGNNEREKDIAMRMLFEESLFSGRMEENMLDSI